MNKEKQIEEMAKDINLADHEGCNGECLGCEYKERITEGYTCADFAIAERLIAKDYRKASEVVAEVLADVMFAISKIVSEHIESDNSLTEAEVDIIHALAELKKKYIESGVN